MEFSPKDVAILSGRERETFTVISIHGLET